MEEKEESYFNVSENGDVYEVIDLNKECLKLAIPYVSFDDIREASVLLYNGLIYHGIFMYPERELFCIAVVTLESMEKDDHKHSLIVDDVVDVDRLFVFYPQKNPKGFFILPNGRIEFDYGLTVKRGDEDKILRDMDIDVDAANDLIESLKKKGGIN